MTASQLTPSMNSINTLTRSCTAGTSVSCAKVPKRMSTGKSDSPRLCCTSANCSARTICCPAKVLTAAAAEPPNSLPSSLRMICCAPATSPTATMLSMSAFWSSLNVTPTRLNAEMPAMGSLSALPTCIAELCKSVPMAWLMSRIACVAPWNDVPLISVNVASTLVAPRMASSLNIEAPAVALISCAMVANCAVVNPAACPVDLTTASVWAMTEFHADASAIEPAIKSPTLLRAAPATLTAAAPIAMNAPVAMVCRALNPPALDFALAPTLSTALPAASAALLTWSSPIKRITTVSSAMSYFFLLLTSDSMLIISRCCWMMCHGGSWLGGQW